MAIDLKKLETDAEDSSLFRMTEAIEVIAKIIKGRTKDWGVEDERSIN